jgi:hypothetical protein
LVIIAILTPDRLLLPMAPWILAVSACSCESLKLDEPAMALAPAALDAGAALDAAALELGAAALELGGADAVLFDGEEQAAMARTPVAATRPAANFLFINDLLVTLSLTARSSVQKRSCNPLA